MLGALLEAQPSEAQEARLASLRLTRAVDDATRDAAAAEPAIEHARWLLTSAPDAASGGRNSSAGVLPSSKETHRRGLYSQSHPHAALSKYVGSEGGYPSVTLEESMARLKLSLGLPQNTGDKKKEDAAAAERSWQAYAAHVAETGEDPLDNYWVAPRGPATRITRWRVTFGEEGGKVVVREARRGARTYTPAQRPAPVRAVLCLTGEDEVEGFDSLNALRAQATEVRWIRGKPGVGEICVQMPTAARPAAVRAAKRAAARRHLAETRA
jgi:hypothetical protein